MSVTVTDPAGAAQIPSVVGNRRMALVKVAFDSSYPTGGEILTPASVGMARIDMVLTNGVSAIGRTVVPVLASGVWKLKAFTSAAAATHTHTSGAITMDGHVHVENADALYTQSASTASTVSTGASAVTAAGGAIAAAAFAEVASLADLSADSVLVVVFGI